MEASPLVKAHDHARAASVATQMSDTTVAISEHTLAAGEFANAAKYTNSIEAMRTLKLMEEHHRRLCELLQASLERSTQRSSSEATEKDAATGDAILETTVKSDASTSGKTPAKPGAIPSLANPRRHSSRDLASSIASNLASARGIRAQYRIQPLSPSVSNDQAPGNMESHLRREGSRSRMQSVLEHQRSGKIPPPIVPAKDSAAQKKTDTTEEPASDDGYSRFYSSFGSLINKLSAPLAFAGLPLITEESQSEEAPETSSSRRTRKHPQTANTEPEWTRNFSGATRRKIHSVSDSFYVVPPSGHTASYASILTFADKEKRRMESSQHHQHRGGADADLAEDDEDDFVDARESPAPLSPGAKRRIGRGRSEKELSNTIEELYTENKSLKDMLDKLSKRLHAFEASAQNSSLALAESIRLRRPGSPLSSAGSGSGTAAAAGAAGTGAEEALRRKNQELEEEMAAAVQRIELLEKDNRKMQRIVEKYREKWEKLKASARARREAQGMVDNVEDEAGPS